MPLPKLPASEVPREKSKRVASRAELLPTAGACVTATALIGSELKAKAVAELEHGLQATKRMWDKDTQAWIVEPDYAARIKCAELVLAYAEGKPVERQVKLTGDFTGYDRRLEALIATPEGLRIAQTLGLIAEKDSQKREKPQNA